MKKILVSFISIFSFSCSDNINSFENIDNINTSNIKQNIKEYYPLDKGNNWTYSLEQFQNDKPNTKFKKMIIHVEEKNDNTAIIKRFYPDSTMQPNMTKAIISNEKIELSRHELLENNMKTLINNLGINSIDILKAPLNKGNSWEGRIFSGGTETIIVEGSETIEVPAGKFQTIKLNHKIKYNNGKEDNLYYWYAKNIGTVKMYEEISLHLNNDSWIKMKSIGILEKHSLN